MKKSNFFIGLCLIVIWVFAVANISLAGSDWKEEQAKMFAKLPFKPGDTIDKSNYEKAKDYLPSGVIGWVKRGEEIIKVGELKYDFAPDASWDELSAKNVGKYALDDQKEVIEKSTGQYPLWVDGNLFPSIDLKNDPDAGIKYMHNIVAARGRIGTLHCVPTTEWVASTGLERMAMSEYIDNYFWNRPDGEQPNPQKYLGIQLYKFIEPYDIRGLAALSQRFIDPRPDGSYAYVPSIRRVKKQSAANRCDPYAGSDFVIDDSFGWAGKNTSMNWTVLREMICLVQLPPWEIEHGIATEKQPNGSFKANAPRFYSGYEKPGAVPAAWGKVDAVWVPRKVVVIQADAKDPYYSYGKCIYYVDPDMGIVHKEIFDRSGEYWKMLVLDPSCHDWVDNGKTVRRTTTGSVCGYVVVDEKTHHASVCACSGEVRGTDLNATFMDPNIKPAMFTPEALGTWSK